MDQQEREARRGVSEVLEAELDLLRGPRPPVNGKPPEPAKDVTEVYRRIARSDVPLSAVCLSGGGIRSASFNLGVLQALARAGVLGKFDYLSTVSGGGYIGSWLQGWIARARRPRAGEAAGAGPARPNPEAAQGVIRQLGAAAHHAGQPGDVADPPKDPLSPEPLAIRRLREFSNYLTPRKGLLSGDTWSVVAIVFRNLLLNWLVILPVLAVLVTIPLAAALLMQRVPSSPEWPKVVAWTALTLGLVSSAATHWMRSKRRGGGDPGPEMPLELRAGERSDRRMYAALSIGLLYVAASLFVLAAAWANEPHDAIPPLLPLPPSPFLHRLLQASVWTVGLPVVGAVFGKMLGGGRSAGKKELVPEGLALLGSGLLAALLLAWLTGGPWSALVGAPGASGAVRLRDVFGIPIRLDLPSQLATGKYLLTILGVPILLLVYALARALFTAIRSKVDDLAVLDVSVSEADREWWARITSRALLAAALWTVGSALALLGVWVFHHGAEARGWVAAGFAAVGGTAGILVAVLGRSAGTSSGRSGGEAVSIPKERLLRAAGPVGVASTVVLLSLGMTWLLDRVGGHGLGTLLWIDLGLLAVALVAGAIVNTNRFSLHGMYRNRLVRSYLGASNPDRRPNAISGFDPQDDALRLADLRPDPRSGVHLLPIIGATMNVLRGQRLAWQERKAESFSMTPLYCGSFRHGYRDSRVYGRPGGIRLGTAMAISGAAANPNMGYVSSPALTFLMGLLNARLGVWLPNPGSPGDAVVSRESPSHATVQLLRELFGLTDADSPYVNLSDGGHFDNLGLYEVVLRRCRMVLVSDASCDPELHLADLGNAIRKIRIDFGIPVEIGSWIDFPGQGGARRPLAYAAWGLIHYAAVDGPGAPDGHFLYLKPVLARTAPDHLPCDVQAYGWRALQFPHESTADQWFSESQLESYRVLGEYLATRLTGDRRIASVQELVDWPRPEGTSAAMRAIFDALGRTVFPVVEPVRVEL